MVNEAKTLAGWESDLLKEVERLQSERSRIDAELQKAAKKLELVRQMRSLEDGSAASPAPDAATPKDSRATPNTVRDMARKILSESSRPLHISEIHSEFLARGYAIPGGGTAFNILAHLVNDKSFVRVARGTYALTGSVPEDQVLRKARRRRRKATARLRVEGE